MDSSNLMRNLNKRFTNGNETSEFNKSKKRKNDNYEIMNHKRARMNDNVVEVIEIIDDSLSEIYEDITEPETTPFRVTSPLTMPIHDIYCQTNLSQSSDKENVEKPETSIQKNRIIITQEIISKHKLDHEKNKIMKIESPKKNEIFPNYNKKIQDTIIRLMSRPQNEYIMKEKHNIKKSDLLTVYSPTAWLNDEIINHYLRMIVDRDPDNLHFFDTFFYLKLSTQGYQSVRRWSKRKDIFAYKKMFIPIHLGNHWCLICVNFIDKTVKYYDSFGGKNPKCLNVIFDYLKEEYENKKNKTFDVSGWQLMHADDCPAQFNGYDCGVFTCINAEYLARDSILNFTQDDMLNLRNRICYEILMNRLCY